MKKQYVIVQHRIENDPKGVPKIKEALLAYPDSEENTKRRIFKWKTVLEVPNIRMREALKDDYRKKRKKKA